jgi:uncharacterized membrane protein
MKFKETKERSVTKAVTFRILIICADLMVIYALTKKINTTIALTILTNLVSTFFYFMHERLWNGIAWGRQQAR